MLVDLILFVILTVEKFIAEKHKYSTHNKHHSHYPNGIEKPIQ